MPNINEQMQQIRDFINNPRKKHDLLKDTANWKLLCSCMDTIEDTEQAINAYIAFNSPDPFGIAYLLVYGALQTLFIQEDAVENLCQALAIGYDLDPQIKEIRDIRNNSIGHPTKRGGGKGNAYNFISQISLTINGFELITTYPDNKEPQFKHVNIPSLVEIQRNIIQKVLNKVIEKLKREEAEHRDKYRDQRLQDVFPPTLDYYFGRISEAIRDSTSAVYGTIHIRLVADIIEAFKNRLRERGILDIYDSVVYLLQSIEYPIIELSTYFGDSMRISINEKSAEIFAFFLNAKIDELIVIAKEIDKTYESEP